MTNTSIEIDATTRIFYLAQAAHGHAEAAQKGINAYRRYAKTLTLDNFKPMLINLTEANTQLAQAIANWESITATIRDNPELQAEAK